jgi:hypothetical protein
MLKNINRQVRECLRRAEDCARKACQSDPKLRQDFLDMKVQWLID